MAKNLLGKKKIKSVFFLAFFLILNLIIPVSAEWAVWSDPSYNFEEVKSLWIEEPVYTYDFEGFDFNDPQNYVTVYPESERKFYKMFREIAKDKVRKELYVVFQKDVTAQKTGTFSPVTEKIFIDEPQYADLVLSIKIQDLGWFYDYYPPYNAWETVIDYETYYIEGRNGKERRVTKEVQRQVLVRRPAGYLVHQSAAGEFVLKDAESGRIVWQYIDMRTRFGYDKTGPESMLERIIKDAFDNMHLKK